MKVMKMEIMFIDFDGLGEEGARSLIEDTRYPNHCIAPDVKKIEVVDIGEWSDDHPLNSSLTCDEEYKRIFKS